MDTLGIIAKELKKLHMTQKSLTDHLGLAQTAFTDWKAGKSRSYEKYLPQIADFLAVDVNYLLGRTAIKNAPAEAGGVGTAYSDEALTLADDFMSLSPERRQIAKDLVASLIRQQGL